MAIEPTERALPTFDFIGEKIECDPLKYLGIGSRFSWLNVEELDTMIEAAAGLDTYFVRSCWDNLRYLLIAIVEANFGEVTETSLREPINNGDFIMHPRNPKQQKAMKRIGHPLYQFSAPKTWVCGCKIFSTTTRFDLALYSHLGLIWSPLESLVLFIGVLNTLVPHQKYRC